MLGPALSPELQDYYDSPEWQRKRKAALIRARFRCERCGCAGEPLDVHHDHYRTLGIEVADDLRVLCRTCHAAADRARLRRITRLRITNRENHMLESHGQRRLFDRWGGDF